MRTITTLAYKFDELNEEAQEKAIENFRNSETDFFWQDEYEKTLDKFCEYFPIKWTSWDIYQGINYRLTIEADYILNLKGIRLLKYIQNNFGHVLYKGKYYGKLVPHVTDKAHPAGVEHKFLYSKCQKENSGVLTGFCGDHDILDPIYNFLEKPSENITFEDLLIDCMESWLKGIKNDYESQQTDEYIAEHLTVNEYEFNEKGERI